MTEFASALSLQERRREITTLQAQAVRSEFEEFCGTALRLAPVTRKAFTEAALMLRNATTALRSGDSLHLAIALEVDVSSLATADATLAANARQKGLTTIRF